ncbi:MAG: hypothetical protein KC431_18685 [Myxococcales bacterium]|nr:hypothetical protein [Myxococcales bacterium]
MSEPGVPHPIESSPSMLIRLLRPNGAVILLGLVFALSLVEILGAFLAYRERISDDDWLAVAEVLAQAQEDGEVQPVFVTSDWLGPRARMELPQVRAPEILGAPDLRGLDRYWLLTHARDRPWTQHMHAELEDLPMPELLAVHRIGELTLHEFAARRSAVPTLSVLAHLQAGQGKIVSEQGTCRANADGWRCKDGLLRRRLLEVDYRPRDCLSVELESGAMVSLDLGTVTLGNRLRGHVGFGDFNARLRSDPTAIVEAWIDGHLAARWLFTDDQGWAAFALATDPGEHDLRLRVGTTITGTWQREGHVDRPNDVMCLEARAFLEEETEEAVEP